MFYFNFTFFFFFFSRSLNSVTVIVIRRVIKRSVRIYVKNCTELNKRNVPGTRYRKLLVV